MERPALDEVPKRPVGRYIVGLAFIAIAAVVSTILTSTALTRQGQDAGVLEVVTEQILLSETLANAGFDVEEVDDQVERDKAVTRLDTTLNWIRSRHTGLRFGSETLDLPADHSQTFDDQIEAAVEPHFGAMARLAEELIENGSSGEKLRVAVTGYNPIVLPMPGIQPIVTRNKGDHIIYTGGKYDSYLQIPVIPPAYRS